MERQHRYAYLVLPLLVFLGSFPKKAESECLVGQALEDQSGYLSNHRLAAVLLHDVIECEDPALVTSWSFIPQTSYAFKTLVLRQLVDGDPMQWTVIGTNDIPVSDVIVNQKSTHFVPSGDRIKVQNGDIIGIAQYDRNPLFEAGVDAEEGTKLHVGINPQISAWPDNLLSNGDIFNIITGGILNTVAFPGGNPLHVAFSATVEEGCTVGHRVIHRNGVLPSNSNAWVFLDNIISCSGAVTSWQFWPKRAFAFKVIVLRQKDPSSTHYWDIVGVNDVPATDMRPNRKNTFFVPIADQFEAQSGDVIGVAFYDDVPIIATDGGDDVNPGSNLYIAVNNKTEGGADRMLTEIDEFVRPGKSITAEPSSLFYTGVPTSLMISLSAEVQPTPTDGYVKFSQSSYQVSEGSGTVTLTLDVQAIPIPQVTVEIQTLNSRGTARADDDYHHLSQLVSFGTSETSDTFTITVTIVDDEDTEFNETFTVAIVGGIGVSEPREATVTIIDNDGESEAGCSVGHEIISRTVDFSHHRFVAVLADNVISCNGEVAEWKFWPQKSSDFKAMVFRQTEPETTANWMTIGVLNIGNTAKWEIIGINDITNVVANQLNTYSVPDRKRIDVRKGDVIGIAQYDDNPLLASDRTDTGTAIYVGYNRQSGNIFTESEISKLKPGDVVDTMIGEALGTAGPLAVSFSAEIDYEEPETDDGEGGGSCSVFCQPWVLIMAIVCAHFVGSS